MLDNEVSNFVSYCIFEINKQPTKKRKQTLPDNTLHVEIYYIEVLEGVRFPYTVKCFAAS